MECIGTKRGNAREEDEIVMVGIVTDAGWIEITESVAFSDISDVARIRFLRFVCNKSSMRGSSALLIGDPKVKVCGKIIRKL